MLLTDEEVANRFVIIEERKRRIIESKLRAQQREEKRLQSEELVARLAEARMQKRMEQQGNNDFLPDALICEVMQVRLQRLTGNPGKLPDCRG